MATFKKFQDLPIWIDAKRLFKKVIALVENADSRIDFKFKNQIIASAGSIPDNIAEGYERDSRLEFINHLSYSKGSTGEVRSQLYRGADCRYWAESDAKEIIDEYQILASHIANFIKYLNNCETKGVKFKNRKA